MYFAPFSTRHVLAWLWPSSGAWRSYRLDTCSHGFGRPLTCVARVDLDGWRTCDLAGDGAPPELAHVAHTAGRG